MKPSLNNVWGRDLGNRLRRELNLPPVMEHENGLLNAVIGDDEQLLVLEPAARDEVALLSLFKTVDRFSLGAHLHKLLQAVSISRHLPVPVQVALKRPDSVVLTVRIDKRMANEAPRYLDVLFQIYATAARS